MHHSEVTVMDAVYAVLLFEISVSSGTSVLSAHNPVRFTIPEDALGEYKSQASEILTRLGLPHLWEQEERRLREESSKHINMSDLSLLDKWNQSDANECDELVKGVLTQVKRNDPLHALTQHVVAEPSRKNKRVSLHQS